MIDTIVVGAALVLENMSAAKEGGLFVALLFWRVLRIVHGIASSVEINSNLRDQKVNEGQHRITNEHTSKTHGIHKELASQILEIRMHQQREKVKEALAAGTTAVCAEGS